MRVIEDRGADADAQEFMCHVACDLGRTAKTVEVALPAGMDQIGSAFERLDAEDGKGFLKRLDRSTKHLLQDHLRRIFRRDLLVQIDRRQVLVLDERRAQFSKSLEAELLGRLDDHRLGDPGIVCHPLQLKGVVEIGPQQEFGYPDLERRHIRQHHADPWPHCTWIYRYTHSLPRVSRSISIAMMMMIPVASS